MTCNTYTIARNCMSRSRERMAEAACQLICASSFSRVLRYNVNDCCAGLCMFKDGAVTCQVPLSELIEEDEIIEERVIR